MKLWGIFENEGDEAIRVVPIEDLAPHAQDAGDRICWCNPRYVDRANCPTTPEGAVVVAHEAGDGRE